MYLRWFDRYVVGFSVFVGPWALRHADNIDFSACFSPWSAAPLRPSSRFRFHCAADALSARYLADHRASLQRCSSATGEPPSSSSILRFICFLVLVDRTRPSASWLKIDKETIPRRNMSRKRAIDIFRTWPRSVFAVRYTSMNCTFRLAGFLSL